VQRQQLPAPAITIDGQPARASTQLGYAGAYSVTLSTALPARGIELHSSYLGHEQTATHAAHLLLAPGAHRLRHTEHGPGALPVAGPARGLPGAHGRGALLLDHLAELRAHLSELAGADVHVDVADIALEQLDRA
jgi:hypothetical protein